MPKKSRSLVAMLVGAAACLSPAVAQAMQQRQSYDFPAQDLGDALRSAAALADIELYASSRDLEGKTAPALKGQLTPREAIEALLAGSGLKARFDARSVVILDGDSPSVASGVEAESIIVTGSRIAGAPAAAPATRSSMFARSSLFADDDDDEAPRALMPAAPAPAVVAVPVQAPAPAPAAAPKAAAAASAPAPARAGGLFNRGSLFSDGDSDDDGVGRRALPPPAPVEAPAPAPTPTPARG